MTLDHIKEHVSSSKRAKFTNKQIKLELSDSSYIRIRAHYDAFVRTWQNENLDPSFTYEEFEFYVSTLFSLRIESISKSLKEFTKTAKRVKIPALIYLVLEQIGRVEVKEYGVTIVPVHSEGTRFTKKVRDKEGKDTIVSNIASPSQMDEISLKLTELEDLGHEMGRGLPRDEVGSQNFMLMQIIDDILITHEAEAHPAYALLRSFIKMESLQDIFLPRITYLGVDEYDHQYKELIRRRK